MSATETVVEAVTQPSPSPASPVAARRPSTFAGLTSAQLALVALAILLAIWGMWVTRALVAPREQHIVKADLSRIVGDYVQAQARTDTPPERVQAEMRRFMASLDGELQRRGRAGEVVLVGEAVLSKNVTDITADVAKAVYASGVPQPRPGATGAVRGQVGQVQPQGAPIALAAAPQAGIGPVPGTAIFGNGPAPAQEGSAQDTAAASDPTLSGAAVSVFGGGDGAGAR
ncbi:TrbI F-type domain-containing protein [uncultured Sphingomonas sp.]|uniref:TrbI F-type domain-containing protein n=1 Tax=uncultured Sphingomonas sp. TaxID=158754 RepID=UPI002592A78E|nr:TrbI F-type domain-containing protein [uncultured Sphingomonas sp.]